MGIGNNQVHFESGQTVSSLVINLAKYVLHGFAMSAAFSGLYYYIEIMMFNIQYGNRIPFVPQSLVLCTVLVLILIGALNRTIANQLWNNEVSNHWMSLLGYGIVIASVVYLSTILITVLLMNFLLIPVAGYAGGLIIVPHSVIITPVIGYFCKIIPSFGKNISTVQMVE